MKQSRLFPPVFISFMAIVLVSVSHLSAAVTSWDDFDSAASGYYESVYHLRDNSTALMLDLEEFNTFKIVWRTDSVQLLGNPDEIHVQSLFNDISINDIFYVMPDELLTLQINSNTSIPDQPSEGDSDIKPSSEPADDIVFKNDGDYIKSMRTPVPSSLLLVTLGLISLRFTRRLRY